MKVAKVLAAAALALMAAGASWAGGRHHHHHHHHGLRVGVYFGVPFGHAWYGPPPYVYYPSYYYYGPPVVIRQAPQVYIERAPPEPAQQAQAFWYYCSNPAGYYPYVQQCAVSWQRVVPTPPPN